jgi:hypothetical protein
MQHGHPEGRDFAVVLTIARVPGDAWLEAGTGSDRTAETARRPAQIGLASEGIRVPHFCANV